LGIRDSLDPALRELRHEADALERQREYEREMVQRNIYFGAVRHNDCCSAQISLA